MKKKTISSSSAEKTTEETPKPSAAHRRLNVFLGQWNMEGQQLKGLFGPAAKITAVQTYEWLAGKFFMGGFPRRLATNSALFLVTSTR